MAEYQNRSFRDLKCKRVQIDEIWSFCYAKQKNVATCKTAPKGAGEAWTWTAICADSKLVLSWLVGGRDADCANVFVADVETRLSNRIQLTSDGNSCYADAVYGAFGSGVDYAQLVKIYGGGGRSEATEMRYSPAE